MKIFDAAKVLPCPPGWEAWIGEGGYTGHGGDRPYERIAMRSPIIGWFVPILDDGTRPYDLYTDDIQPILVCGFVSDHLEGYLLCAPDGTLMVPGSEGWVLDQTDPIAAVEALNLQYERDNSMDTHLTPPPKEDEDAV